MYDSLTNRPPHRKLGVSLLTSLAMFVGGLCSASAVAEVETVPNSPAAPQTAIVVGNSEPRVVKLRSDFDVGISISSEIFIQSGTNTEASFRRTEAQLLAAKQRSVFEQSGQWGVVRLYPEYSVIPELMLDLVVLKSDGRELLIKAQLTAVSGDVLLAETYLDRSTSSDYASEVEDPFADLFHRIHNDVAFAASKHTQSQRYLDSVSFLRYAQQLAPEAFPGYLASKAGRWKLLREPAEQDPMYARIARLRDYELLFVDTIDEQLSGALREIDVAYKLWLKASKEQLDWLERRRARGVNVESFSDDSAFARHQAVYAAYRSLKIHEQELFELVLDLESESRSTALEIDENIVKLEGTLEQQYREWRETLLNIILLENAF